MKRDNKVVKFAIIVLALTMVALILVSGTYAKYTSSATATSTATVAKWAIKVNDNDISGSATTPKDLSSSINLFDTRYDSDVSSDEDDVNAGLIAPGTSGEFTLTVKNDSQVTAEYTIALSANVGSIPIEFSKDKSTWVASPASLGVAEPTEVAAGASSTDLKIYWRWAFTGDASTNFTSTQTDETDTALGEAATAPTATVTATITVNQVD